MATTLNEHVSSWVSAIMFTWSFSPFPSCSILVSQLVPKSRAFWLLSLYRYVANAQMKCSWTITIFLEWEET